MIRKAVLFGWLLILLAVPAAAPRAQDAKSQELVDKARYTLERMLASPDFSRMPGTLKRAYGVIIMPSIIKGGFILGGEGGSGVLMTRDANNQWSYPAFYGMGAGSIGLQIGFQDSEVVFAINTLKGLNAILNNNFKLGVDASVALGPVGQGIEGSTTTAAGADIEAFSKNRGLFAGGAFEGAVIYELAERNRDYYGLGSSARAIVMDRSFTNANAESLRAVLNGLK